MRRAAFFTVSLGLFTTLLGPPHARAVRPLITSFAATIVEPPPRHVRFEWAMSRERADEQISCTIDVDVDDPGTVDASVPNCGENTTFDHTYDEPGLYRAALTATSSAGGSDRVMVTIVLR
jgi:hypothetical protein